MGGSVCRWACDLCRVRGDLVIEVGAEQPLLVGRLRHRGHRVERRVGDVLDRHRDAEFPDEHLLVVRGGDEPLGLLGRVRVRVRARGRVRDISQG